jgi:hypothetical protein
MDSQKADIGKIMFFPYMRIAPMRLTMLFGGFPALLMRSQFAKPAALVLSLCIKTAADAGMHIIEHLCIVT